jgi:hypothetical protein
VPVLIGFYELPAAGRYTVNMLPLSGAFSAVIRPRQLSTMSLHIASPSPVPLPLAFVVKNGSNIV